MTSPDAAPRALPGGRLLCRERVYGPPGGRIREIAWTLTAHQESLDAAARHYATQSRVPVALENNSQEFTYGDAWRVTVFAASERARFPGCGEAPRADEGVLVLTAQAFASQADPGGSPAR